MDMNLLPGDAAYTCSKEMLAAVGALAEMQGIVRMMQQICSGVVFEQHDKGGILLEILSQISGEVTRDLMLW